MNQVTVEILILLGAIVGLFIWNRSESRSDIRQMQDRMDANSRQIQELIRSIQMEIKDFHGRLCSIEGKGEKVVKPE